MLIAAEDSTLCQLCHDALLGQIPGKYDCCRMPHGLVHPVIGCTVHIDEAAQFQKRKCKLCKKKDRQRQLVYLLCVKCRYLICQDCYRNDAVSSHDKCQNPKYRMLLSRTFFDLMSQPLGRCGSCSMTFSKGKHPAWSAVRQFC